GTKGLAVDTDRLGIRLAADLLRLPGRLGVDAAQFALHLAGNLQAAALALGTEALGNGLALGDHPVLHLAAHRVDIVDALDAHVPELDSQFRHQPGGAGEDLGFELFPAQLGALGEGDILPLLLDFVQLLHIHVPVPGTHDLFQFGAGNNVPHHRVDDVVEAGAAAALIPHTAQKLQGVDNAPAGGGVHLDELPPQGGDLGD